MIVIYSSRVCVDAVKRYHLMSNVSARSYLFGVRTIWEDAKLGAFRQRPKQLNQLGISVCEINYRRYASRILPEKKLEYIENSIIDSIVEHTENDNQILG